MASRGVEKSFGIGFMAEPSLNEDSDKVFQKHGIGVTAHHVGAEVSSAGAEEILREALKISLGTDEDVFKRADEFKFYDLGSGFGKFPMYASFMGFRESTGIELDSQRAKYAAKRWDDMKQDLPGCAENLKYVHDDFMKNDEWTTGKEKRVIFVDAALFGFFWPQLVAKMESAEFGADSVVALLGRPDLGTFNGRSQINVQTSLSDKEKVTFFTKCLSKDPVECGRVVEIPAWEQLAMLKLHNES